MFINAKGMARNNYIIVNRFKFVFLMTIKLKNRIFSGHYFSCSACNAMDHAKYIKNGHAKKETRNCLNGIFMVGYENINGKNNHHE